MSKKIRELSPSPSPRSDAPDFDLPESILCVIPMDPYDQLDLARKITSMAIASRVLNLETETERLRGEVYEKDRVICGLRDEVEGMRRSLEESESRMKSVLDENMRLAQERESLAVTVRKLGRDLSKLETFKKQLLQSLNEDASPLAGMVDIGTYDRPISKTYDENEGKNDYSRHHSWNGRSEAGRVNGEAIKGTSDKLSMTPYYITPRLTPSGTPIASANISPKAVSAVGSPKASGVTTPTKLQYDSRTALTTWYPSSQQSSAANSPPRSRPLPGRPPRIDGKEFFRQARNHLSYEQFSAFLANIKELNAHKQSRKETLRKAEEIFGTENNDLYISFHGLLHRNAH